MQLSTLNLALILVAGGLGTALPSNQARAASSFQACLVASKVTTLTSANSTYAAASLAFNRRLSYAPAAIVYPWAVSMEVSI